MARCACVAFIADEIKKKTFFWAMEYALGNVHVQKKGFFSNNSCYAQMKWMGRAGIFLFLRDRIAE